jgi:hypothetical protein
MNLQRQRGLSLIWISVLFMLLGLVSMGFLYTIRYGHLPMQDVWSKWGKSANVIGNELKNVTGIQELSLPGQNSSGVRQAATVESGVRRCTIDGKTVYSDTACLDSNPTSTNIELNDAKGFVKPPPPVEEASASNAEQDLRLKALEKALQKAQR